MLRTLALRSTTPAVAPRAPSSGASSSASVGAVAPRAGVALASRFTRGGRPLGMTSSGQGSAPVAIGRTVRARAVVEPERIVQIEIEDDPAAGPLNAVHSAIKAGKLTDLARALREDPSQAKSVHDGTPALVRAATRGNPAFVELLLAHDADPEVTDFVGDYPITMAARCEHLEVVQALLPRYQAAGNDEAIHQALVASANQNRETVRTYLLDLGYRTNMFAGT